MPLNSTDRFFSTHTTTHYALYLWQPNRSTWGEDDPIEALTIWDISEHSPYRPSEDPTGKGKPSIDEGPRVLRRLSFADLDFYEVRQKLTPILRNLELDESHVYVVEEDHPQLQGQQTEWQYPRLHEVKSVGIPFGVGPRWEHGCVGHDPFNIKPCKRWDSDRGFLAMERSPALAPCWRHYREVLPV